MSSSYSTSKSDGWKSLLLRHETVLLLVLAFEWFYFNSIGRRFGSLDNTFDIVRHSVEIGLLALVMTPIILTGGIDLSVGSLLGLCAILFGKLWRDAGLPIPVAMACTLGIGALAGGLNALLITWLGCRHSSSRWAPTRCSVDSPRRSRVVWTHLRISPRRSWCSARNVCS